MNNVATPPKDQANALYKKFQSLNGAPCSNKTAKYQAIACVEEILKAIEQAFSMCPNQEDGFGKVQTVGSVLQDAQDYWNDVKIEIAIL